MSGLLRHASPFITLDVSKTNPFAPHTKSPLALGRGLDGRGPKVPGIPNKNLNIDLRTLHLHLTLRANEIMACAETMWDWVHETQEAIKTNAGRRATLPGEHHAAVLDLNREDFNGLLLNFEKYVLMVLPLLNETHRCAGICKIKLLSTYPSRRHLTGSLSTQIQALTVSFSTRSSEFTLSTWRKRRRGREQTPLELGMRRRSRQEPRALGRWIPVRPKVGATAQLKV